MTMTPFDHVRVGEHGRCNYTRGIRHTPLVGWEVMRRRSDFYIPWPFRWPLQVLVLAVLPAVCAVIVPVLFAMLASRVHSDVSGAVRHDLILVGIGVGIVLDFDAAIGARR